MLIAIIGNIASGKSTLARTISAAKNYRILKIDDFRKRHNKAGDPRGDRKSWEYLISHIQKGGPLILEATGVGKYFERCLCSYPGPEFIIKVDTPAAECKQNHARRLRKGYKLPPMPWDRPINDVIDRVDILLKDSRADVVYKEKEDLKIILSIIPEA